MDKKQIWNDLENKTIKSLRKLAPVTAVIIDKYDKEKEVSVENVRVGDIFVVRPGETVPVDGVVIEGNSAVNESMLTGEGIPVDKHIGSSVLAATTNTSGFIKCRATRIGPDTTLSQIIRMASEAMAIKAPVEKTVDKAVRIFALVVIAIAAITFVFWMIVESNLGVSLSRAVAVLLISCPPVLWISSKFAISAGIGAGAKNGILFDTAADFENAGKTKIVALDKTGTITRGEPMVTDVFTPDSITRSGYSLINTSENELLKIAGLLERKSDHPLAKAVVDYVGDVNNYIEDLDEEEEDITDFEVLPGYGLKGKYLGHEVIGASLKYISQITTLLPEVREKAVGLAAQGKTPLCFTRDKKLLGIIAVTDNLKADSAAAIKELKNMGIHVVMLTGDNVRTAMSVGDQAGVDEIAAEILPEGKQTIIKELAKHGKIVMVGDGIGEAKALSQADLGIALGAGEDILAHPADVILMKNSLLDVAAAIRLSRATLRNIDQNLLWMIIFNVIAIPLAAGVCIKPFGFELSPLTAAVVMILSNLVVYMNTRRLYSINIHDSSKDKPQKNPIKEELLSNKHE